MRGRGVWELFVLSARFSCAPRNVLNNSLFKKKKKEKDSSANNAQHGSNHSMDTSCGRSIIIVIIVLPLPWPTGGHIPGKLLPGAVVGSYR